MRRRRGRVAVIILTLCLMLLNDSSPFAATISQAVAAGARRSMRGGSPSSSPASSSSPSSSCRCVPDQFEAVLRTAEREIDLQAGVEALAAAAAYSTSMMAASEVAGPDSTSDDSMYGGPPPHFLERAERVEGGGEGWGVGAGMLPSPVMADPDKFTAASESTTSIYYDYVGGRMATVEQRGSRRVRKIIDHNAGVQYIINSDGACLRLAIRERRMKKMCLPDRAVMTAKFILGADQPVSMWKYVGPHNSTLRTLVERKRCVPIYEETYSLSDGYISLSSTVYTNVRIGIRDSNVFNPPSTCVSGDRIDEPGLPPDGEELN